MRFAAVLFCTGNVPATELQSFLADKLPTWLDGLDPNAYGRIRAAKSVSDVDYLARLRTYKDVSQRAAAKLEY